MGFILTVVFIVLIVVQFVNQFYFFNTLWPVFLESNMQIMLCWWWITFQSVFELMRFLNITGARVKSFICTWAHPLILPRSKRSSVSLRVCCSALCNTMIVSQSLPLWVPLATVPLVFYDFVSLLQQYFTFKSCKLEFTALYQTKSFSLLSDDRRWSTVAVEEFSRFDHFKYIFKYIFF